MTPRIKAAFATNSGLLTRQQAEVAGLDGHQIDRLVREGAWVAVRRGVYAERELWDGLDSYRERQLYVSRAASKTITLPHVMSHDSAALEIGMSVLLPRPFLPHVTRPDVRGSRHRYGVKHHGAVFHASQVVDVDGIDVLNAARTAVDIGREHGILHGLAACDSALRLGCSRRQLELAYEPMACWPGIRMAREAVELADGGAESLGESLGRSLVLELGIGRPQTQFGLRDESGRVAWCDMRVGRHVFEFDGRVKYQRRQEGGLAELSPDEVVWHEKQRQDWVCGLGLGMSRIVWADVLGKGRQKALIRLAREYEQTLRRYGDRIEDLAPYIIRRPR
jgi:hypothetical protein